MKKILIVFLAICCLALLPVACKQRAEETKTANGQTDSNITTIVKGKLAQDPVLRDKDLSVSTDDGVVTVGGKVETQAQADKVVDIAKSVEGVRTVRSHLKTEPEETASNTSSTSESLEQSAKDAGITAKVKLKLAADDHVKASDIDVETNDQIVTLKGNVKTRAEEQRAVRLAHSVDDVRDVVSDLKVKGAS